MQMRHIYKGGINMGKSNKSKRFIQQGKNAITKYDERFPYRMTYAEAEERKNEEIENITRGGF
jgi:hypothetical protein